MTMYSREDLDYAPRVLADLRAVCSSTAVLGGQATRMTRALNEGRHADAVRFAESLVTISDQMDEIVQPIRVWLVANRGF